MINLFRAGIVMLVFLSGCGSETPTHPNNFTPLTSIKIVAVTPSIAAHTSIKLTAIGDFSGLYTRDITDQVAWASNAPTVADFANAGSPGRVTGQAPGVAKLTATKGNVTASYQLTVSNATVTALAISPVAPTVPKGLTTQFTFTGTFSDTTTQDLTYDVTWGSDTSSVATVSDDAGSKGLAQTHLVGSSTISAKFYDQAPVTAVLTVTAPQLQSITITPASSTLLSLSTVPFQATGHYSDGATPDVTSQVVWSSSRPDIATVAGGTAKTLIEGTTSISASLDSVSGAASIKVTGGNLTGITISPANTKLVKNTTTRIAATGTFSNGATRDITALVQWSIANPAIATTSAPGVNLAWLTAVTETPLSTPTKLIAKVGSLTAETNLTVIAPLLSSILITANRTDLTAGTGDRFTLTGSFNDGTKQDLTFSSNWTSGNVAIATVTNTAEVSKGRVTGVAPNVTPVTISATYGGITATMPVTIKVRTLESLEISGPANITSGKQEMFIAKAHYNDGTQIVTEDAVWTIDKPNVAILADALNQPGQVVAVDSGTATLTATFGGKTQAVNFLVP
ncbi:MAG TPA: Ig-like domain-containing protein [Desulfuromonadaceae bacterium]|jgi:hypothetical protein